MRTISFFRLSLGILLLVFSCGLVQGQTTSFSYQGKLADGGTPANGTYQVQFKLYDTAGINTGTQIGSTMTFDGGSGNPPAVQVTNGIFTVLLDFGAGAFPGANRFLEISVKRPADASYTQLDPRQQVNSTPYAVKSLTSTNADTATNSTQLGGVAANQYVVTSDSRMTDARTPTAGSGNYIQNNPPSQQAGSFNISGNGTTGGTLTTGGLIVDAGTLIVDAFANRVGIAVGPGATLDIGGGADFDGANDPHAIALSYRAGGFRHWIRTRHNAGAVAGNAIDFFVNNSMEAGDSGEPGVGNVHVMTLDNGNVGVGTTSPGQKLDVVGTINTSTQYDIGNNRVLSVSGTSAFPYTNVFIGVGAGQSNIPDFNSGDGHRNTFVGSSAGFSNIGGEQNSFFGQDAGRATTFGKFNSFFGKNAGLMSQLACCNSFFGAGAGQNTLGNFTIGVENSFFGYFAGISNIDGGRNSFFGVRAGDTNNAGDDNTIIGAAADVGSGDLNNATAIGARAQVNQSNSLVLGSINGVNLATADTNVGIGITSPATKLHIADNSGQILFGGGGCGAGHVGFGFAPSLTCGNYSILGNGTHTFINRPAGGAIFFRENNVDQLTIASGGVVSIVNLGSAGGTQLCRNLSNQISNCSSSLRYKTNVAPFFSGLSLIKQLRPITFDWKQGGMRDVGFGAEDLARVNPLFVTYNGKGEVEGVKYDRLSVVFVNAFNEQQSQIDHLQKLIENQQQQIDALKKLVCATNPHPEICKN